MTRLSRCWLLLPLALCTANATAATLYVSTTGNNAWSGALQRPNAEHTDGPLASLAGARDAIRKLKARGPLAEPVTVLVADGAYRLAEPFALTPQDSGTKQCPITYAAAQGAKPIICGGRPITGWRKGKGELWTAHVPGVAQGKWYFHQLFVNHKRAVRARTPNQGYLRTDGPITPMKDRAKARGDASSKVGFRFKPGDIKTWPALDDVNVFAYHSWTASLHWIKSVDEAEHVVRFTNRSGWPLSYWEEKERYVVENYRAALDSPGEWYLERSTGTLYYWPRPGEDMAKAHVAAPALDVLVRFDGEPELGLYVEHVTLRGLSFQHADWLLPKDKIADGQGAAFQQRAAVMLTGARSCTLDRCEIAHVGLYALWLRSGSQDNLISQCHIHDLGTGGIRIGETHSPRNAALAADYNVVDNCFIHDGGHVFPAGHGVWIGRASYNTISHCEICDFYYSGVAIGWSWGYAPSSANHNVLEFCHIHHIGKGVLSDMGGIYTLGVSPGTRIANNIFHDIYAYSYGGWGLYTDEGSSHILMENNIVYDTKSGSIHQHYGKENIFRNNVLAFSREAQVIRSRTEDHLSFSFDHNIVLFDNGQLFGGQWGNDEFRLDYNVYWDASGQALEFGGDLLDEWQARGHDAHSVIADPLFVDAANRNFALRPGSPALELGFHPIDASSVGLYGPKEWVELPERVVHSPVSPDMRPPRDYKRNQPIDDDFESTKVGQPPALAHTQEEGGKASIRVTDAAAAVGKHSLCFTDAPGLTHEWNPHMYYRPNFRRGMAKASFFLRLEPGAKMYHEWRDSRSPYRVGPAFYIAPDGQLTVSKKPLLKLPHGQWFKIEITCQLGHKATGAFDFTITLPGRQPQTLEAVACRDPKFRALMWFGFSSTATDKRVFYLDELRLQLGVAKR